MATRPPPPLPPVPPLDLCTVLTESKRIINAHSRHFLALSVLFLLPLSFSLTVYPTLQTLLNQPATHNVRVFISLPRQAGDANALTTSSLLLPILFSLFVFVLSLLATGSVTYSVFHGFYGRPVKLVSAIGSALTSFFPLLITVVLVEVIVSLVLLVSVLLLFLVIKGVELVGFKVQFSSPYFIGLCVALSVVLLLVLLYLQLNWTLACVVVVVESGWGLGPLKRSNLLMKGMRRGALTLVMCFGFFAAILLWACSVLSLGIDTSNGWKSWAFVVQIVVTSTLLTLLFLYNVAANTVLYMYCKAVHGELAWEIAEEFAREYVSLPFGDGKVPHVVSVAYT